MTYAVDRHLWPIDITSNGNTIAWNEGTTELSGSISTGTYYAHSDSGLSTYPGLWDEIVRAMNNQSADTYAASAATPSGSNLTNSGVQVDNIDGNAWAWDFADSAFDLDLRLLGYHPDSSSPSQSSSITSPYSIYGKWQSYIWWSVRGASDKRRDFLYDVDRSSDRLERSYELEYGDGVDERMFDYQYVPAAHVYPRRAEDADHADNGGLPAPSSGKGDINNQLYDLHRKAQRGGEILVEHDRGDASAILGDVSQWEVYKATGEKFSAWANEDPVEDLAEQYNVSWEAQIVDELTSGGRKSYVTTP